MPSMRLFLAEASAEACGAGARREEGTRVTGLEFSVVRGETDMVVV